MTLQQMRYFIAVAQNLSFGSVTANAVLLARMPGLFLV